MTENDKHYLEDRKYIHETLVQTTKHLGKIDEKFDNFKLEVTKSIAVIQTKLAFYAVGASLVTSVIVKVVLDSMRGN